METHHETLGRPLRSNRNWFAQKRIALVLLTLGLAMPAHGHNYNYNSSGGGSAAVKSAPASNFHMPSGGSMPNVSRSHGISSRGYGAGTSPYHAGSSSAYHYHHYDPKNNSYMNKGWGSRSHQGSGHDHSHDYSHSHSHSHGYSSDKSKSHHYAFDKHKSHQKKSSSSHSLFGSNSHDSHSSHHSFWGHGDSHGHGHNDTHGHTNPNVHSDSHGTQYLAGSSADRHKGKGHTAMLAKGGTRSGLKPAKSKPVKYAVAGHGKVQHHHRFYHHGKWVKGDYPFDPDADYSSDDSDSGGSVPAQVQQALADAGYYTGDVDGDIGPQTQQAIAQFQADHNLVVTGDIDDDLVSALGLA